MLLNGVLLRCPMELVFAVGRSKQPQSSADHVHENHGGERHNENLIEKTPKGSHERKISEDGSYRIPSTRANDGEQEKREGQGRYD